MATIKSTEITTPLQPLDALKPPACLVDSYSSAMLAASLPPRGTGVASELEYLAQFLPTLPDGRTFELVFSRSQLLHALEEGRQQIEKLARKCLAESGLPLIVVGLLEGARPTVEAVTAGLNSEIQIEYMKISSYDTANSYTGTVQLKSAPLEVRGRRVALVDDMLDSGRSLRKAWELLADWGADLSNSASMVLIDRVGVPKEASADHVLMEYDRGDGLWIAGAGLDYGNLYRWRDHIIAGPPQT